MQEHLSASNVAVECDFDTVHTLVAFLQGRNGRLHVHVRARYEYMCAPSPGQAALKANQPANALPVGQVRRRHDKSYGEFPVGT